MKGLSGKLFALWYFLFVALTLFFCVQVNAIAQAQTVTADQTGSLVTQITASVTQLVATLSGLILAVVKLGRSIKDLAAKVEDLVSKVDCAKTHSEVDTRLAVLEFKQDREG